MKTPDISTAKLANYVVAIILVLVPFHAFLSLSAASLLGHYTLLRLWDEFLLVMLIGIAMIWVVHYQPTRRWLAASTLIRLIGLYVVVSLLLGMVAYLKHDVTPKALAYGLLVNLRYLIWFVMVILVAKRSGWLQRHWIRLLIVPAIVVTTFAVLQYTVLPHNFLSHFGYNSTTIAPIETINHNSQYIRVGSTLRGANPLGAYMVIVMAALVAAWSAYKRHVWAALIGLLSLAALVFSFSRSAWIGAVLAVGVAVWLQLKTRRLKVVVSSVAVALMVLAVGGFWLLHNGSAVENALYHTDNHSKIAISSNQAHASALKTGIEDVVHQPYGAGPGTAGPASVYNGAHGARIAENYFVQIAQEVGWVGLALYLAVTGLVAAKLYHLYHRRASPLALALLASLIGVTFVNLLSHAWADDTLAYLWWGLAGIALGSTPTAVESEPA